jgi:hypothetical protein
MDVEPLIFDATALPNAAFIVNRSGNERENTS